MVQVQVPPVLNIADPVVTGAELHRSIVHTVTKSRIHQFTDDIS
jgi:hypothetical protein